MDYMYQDKPYIFARYDQPMRGDIFVNDSGNVMRRASPASGITRMILKPKEVFHTFGGVVFKEGEMELSKAGEWYLFESTAKIGMGTGIMHRRLYLVSLA